MLNHVTNDLTPNAASWTTVGGPPVLSLVEGPVAPTTFADPSACSIHDPDILLPEAFSVGVDENLVFFFLQKFQQSSVELLGPLELRPVPRFVHENES